MPKWISSYALLALLVFLPQPGWTQQTGGFGGTSSGVSAGSAAAPAGSYGAPAASSPFGAGVTTPYGPAAGGMSPYGPAAGATSPYGAPPSTAGPLTTTTPAPGTVGGVSGPFPLANPPSAGMGSMNPQQVQGLLNSPEAQAILNNPAALTALAQKFGISPSDIQNIRGELVSGTLSQDQLCQISSRLTAIQSSPAESASIANALGLSPQQIASLQVPGACPNGQSQQNPTAGNSPQLSTLSPQASAVEGKFRTLDIPGQLPSSPDLSTLSQFGYSLFAQGVSTFAPVQNVPVGDDYIIGPGDQLVVLEWGLVNQTVDLNVDLDGSIQIPQVGPCQVAGLTFPQAKKLVEKEFERIHGVTANVTMGQLRSIQVFVVGQVTQPGAYTVSSLSRISNVLQQAGGISKAGSLRNIELKRHNQRIDVFDLYDLLLRGDSSHDIRLENNDVIFVPVIGKVVAIAGDVKVPAIFEVKSTPTISHALNLAGGVTAFGYSEHVQVERVQNHQRTIVVDVNLDQLKSHPVSIRDGDLIKVYPVLPDHTNGVMLTGNVHRPGEYQWYDGMRVSDLVQRAQGLLQHTYFSYALIKRVSGPQKLTHYVPVDLGAALSGGEQNSKDLKLQKQDELQIFSMDELRDLPHVSVIGEVRNPGDYPLTEQMRLSDLIYQAGGLKDDADKRNAEVARTQVINAHAHYTYMSIDLDPVLSGERNRDIILRNNDQVYVKVATDWHLPESVTLAGQVARPGPYVIRRGERLSSVLARCGGLLSDAFPQGIMLVRASVQKQEQETLDQARSRLNQQLAQYTMTMSAAGLASSSAGANNPGAIGAGVATLQQLLAQASTEQAQGRVVIHMTTVSRLTGTPNDVVLNDGDTITIPRLPSSVAVLGQVNNPAAIIAQPGKTVADYLYQAGGPNKNGDVGALMVIKADGSVMTQEALSNGPRESLFPLLSLTSGGIMGRTLSAGDTIYVPDNMEDIPSYIKLTERKDIAQIVSSAAMSLAVVGLMARTF